MITQEELRLVLKYDPKTGDFIRLISNSPNSVTGEVIGCLTVDGYKVIMIDNISYRAHRLAFLYMDGYLPENDVDHINRDRCDNRWSNLRHVSRSCNCRNSSIRSDNSSGVKGVSWYPSLEKWRVKFKIEKKHIHGGYFINKDNAVKARWEMEKKYNYPSCNTTSTAFQYLRSKGLL